MQFLRQQEEQKEQAHLEQRRLRAEEKRASTARRKDLFMGVIGLSGLLLVTGMFFNSKVLHVCAVVGFTGGFVLLIFIIPIPSTRSHRISKN
jgi:hypothetical protein